MAERGLYTTAGAAITTNTDTEVIAAPGAGKRIYLIHVAVNVSVAGNASLVRLEEGAGGATIAAGSTAALGTALERAFTSGRLDYPGYALPENTALNAETTGTAAATLNVAVVYQVR